MRVSIAACCLFCIALMTVAQITALQIMVKPGEDFCISEMVNRNDLLSGDFTVSPDGMRITAIAFDPKDNEIYNGQNEERGKFDTQAVSPGDYKVCFYNNDGVQVDKKVTLKLAAGVEAKDYANVAKQSNLKPLESELKRLEDMVASIHTEMQFLEGREKVMRVINDGTNTKVIAFGGVSVLILVAICVGQVTYLKSFFKKKHLID